MDVGDAMNLYGYNIRGPAFVCPLRRIRLRRGMEVTRLRKAYGGQANAVRRWGANPDNPGDIVAGQTFGYDYDPIGNRTRSKRGDYSHEYAANELNQMTSRGVPGVAHLLGSADETATVTVNGQSVTRQDAYWYKDLAVNNDNDPQYPEVVIDAAWSNILSSVTGNVFVAETPEGFGYDGDGNMTNDGRFAYTWDGDPTSPRLRRARNRLIAVETLSAVVAASGAPQVRVEYAYDTMSCRIGKTVYSDFTTNEVYAATNHTAYLYDGWNLISELTYFQTHTLTNFYTWGLDLSGSLQGAGGIGGLLATVRSGDPEPVEGFFTADANGNIGQLLDAADPTDILAHYEYSPFGETLVAVGDLAKVNPFRFSTKYHEDESGLVYYGYRYYMPEIGRWVNRDPIEERGGLNVYGFVGNEAINYVDPDGHAKKKTISKADIVKCVTKEMIKKIGNAYNRAFEGAAIRGNVERFCQTSCKDKDHLDNLISGLTKEPSFAEHLLSMANCLGISKTKVKAEQDFIGEKTVQVASDSVIFTANLEITWKVETEIDGMELDVEHKHSVSTGRTWSSSGGWAVQRLINCCRALCDEGTY